MRKIYIRPTVTVLVTEDICESELNNATVYDSTGTKPKDTFDINENTNPGGGDNSWYDNPDNWGGD